jgi:hypothetical protein
MSTPAIISKIVTDPFNIVKKSSAADVSLHPAAYDWEICLSIIPRNGSAIILRKTGAAPTAEWPPRVESSMATPQIVNVFLTAAIQMATPILISLFG